MTVVIQLIDANYCLLSNFGCTIPNNVMVSHGLSPTVLNGGYIMKISMLNSLKRCLEEYGVIF